MSWITRRALKLGLLLSVAAGIAAFATSGIHAQILDAYLLALGGVLLLALVRATRAAPTTPPSPYEAALAQMRAPEPESHELALERELALSRINAFHLHIRVRPLLREIAAHRLRRRYGLELDDEPERARELVGSAAWEVVRPERPPPADRLARGPSAEELRRIITELERL